MRNCCGNIPRIPIHQFLYRPTSVSHCIFVYILIGQQHSLCSYETVLSLLLYLQCRCWGTWQTAEKCFMFCCCEAGSCCQKGILLPGRGGDAVCHDCYGCILYCEFILTLLFYVLKIIYNNIHLNFAVVNMVSHKRSSNVSLVLTPHFFSVLSCI